MEAWHLSIVWVVRCREECGCGGGGGGGDGGDGSGVAVAEEMVEVVEMEMEIGGPLLLLCHIGSMVVLHHFYVL